MPRPKKNSGSVFASKLTELRKKNQMTQVELAEKTGIARGVIAYYETSAKNPTIDTVQKFADIFGVPITDLITDAEMKAEAKPGPPSKVDVLCERLKKLSPHRQRQICKLIETAIQA